MAKKQVIMVERETYEYNEKTYFSYFIKGNIRGKDVKIAIMPPDLGGFAVLDIVFGNAMQAELKITPFEMKGEKGAVISGNTYAVFSKDENGEIYECKVKPFRPSDKALLNMLVR